MIVTIQKFLKEIHMEKELKMVYNEIEKLQSFMRWDTYFYRSLEENVC